MTTTKLGLTETANGQANYLNVNTALSRLDQLVFARVIDRNLSAPPGSPANGAMYIPAATATGAWAGKENNLAWWLTDANQWFFLAPAEGMGLVYVLDENIFIYHNGTAWAEFSGGGGGSVDWGAIGGTLADQTDLQEALNDKEQVLTAGANITIDRTDPDNPVVSASASSGMTNPMTTQGDMVVEGTGGAPERLAKGTDGQILSMVSGSPEWADAGSGGLTSFTESYNTAVPNNILNSAMLVATGAGTNVDAVYAAKGTGSTLAQLADSTTTGGNKRGTRATDWQKFRGNADQVASGVSSTIAGGENNKASGSYSFSVGSGNSSTGGYSTAIGRNNTASGEASTSLGGFGAASGDYSYTQGNTCIADAAYSSARGLRSLARGVYGAQALCTKNIFNDGDCQARTLILVKRTSNATPVIMTSDNAAASASNQLNIPIRSSFLIKGRISAHNQSSNDASAWEFSALMKSTTGGTVSLVGSPTPTLIAQDAGSSTWDVAIGVNDTTKTFTVTVTGAASGVTQWTCHLESIESTT